MLSALHKKTVVASVLCLCASLTACQAPGGFVAPSSAPVVSTDVPEEIASTGQDIVGAVQDWLRTQGTRGAVAVSYRGEPVIKQGFGRSTETPYPVASLSKAVTAVCLQDLLNTQQISTQMTVAEAMPQLLDRYPPTDARLASVTLADLMSHNSGIHSRFHRDYISDRRAYRVFDMEAQFKALAGERLAGQPGSGYHYSNANYLLLGLAISSLSQQPYTEYCNENILEPAGIAADMNPDWRVMSAWGGWRISASDYLKFLNTYFSDSQVLDRDITSYQVDTPVGGGASYIHGAFTREANGGARFWHAGSWRWKSQSIDDKFGAYFVTREDGLMVSINYATAAQGQVLTDLQNRLITAMRL